MNSRVRRFIINYSLNGIDSIETKHRNYLLIVLFYI